jgi:hypothetical protein
VQKRPGAVAPARTRPTENVRIPVDTRRIPPAGDGFYAAAKARDERRLRELEERLRHELLGDEERQELRDEILKLRG